MGRDDDDDLDLDLVRVSAREFLAGRGDKDSIGDLAAMDWLGCSSMRTWVASDGVRSRRA